MNTEKLEEITQTQSERIFHIDFRLRFLGTVTRSDLVGRFGIKEAAATRDIAFYRDIAPDNLIYDSAARKYFSTEAFQPVFDHSPEQALAALTTGVGDDSISRQKPLLANETPMLLSIPDIDVLAAITSAIHQERPANICYHSTSSGITKRTIVPFSLISNGLRWHVRAYDRKHSEFRDFVLTRMDSAKLDAGEVEEHERKDADHQWNRMVEIQLVPHPNPDNVTHPETIVLDHHMSEGELRINVRAAVAGYLLRRWNIDCSEDHSLVGREYQLWLGNHPTLYGVNSASLAPGYTEAVTQ
ncbi:MAG: WYL domain-containing protein [Candidatus Thiodiazotropha endolucinida]